MGRRESSQQQDDNNVVGGRLLLLLGSAVRRRVVQFSSAAPILGEVPRFVQCPLWKLLATPFRPKLLGWQKSEVYL